MYYRKTKNNGLSFFFYLYNLIIRQRRRELIVLHEVNADTELDTLSAFLALAEDQWQREVQLESCDGVSVDETDASRTAREAVGEFLESVLDALLDVVAALFTTCDVLESQ